MSAVLYHRTTAALRDAVGPGSAGIPALVLLGLAAAGRDVTPLRREALAALAGDLAPDVRAALERLFFGPGAASELQAGRLQAASEADEAGRAELFLHQHGSTSAQGAPSVWRPTPPPEGVAPPRTDDPFDVGFGFDG